MTTRTALHQPTRGLPVTGKTASHQEVKLNQQIDPRAGGRSLPSYSQVARFTYYTDGSLLWETTHRLRYKHGSWAQRKVLDGTWKGFKYATFIEADTDRSWTLVRGEWREDLSDEEWVALGERVPRILTTQT